MQLHIYIYMYVKNKPQRKASAKKFRTFMPTCCFSLIFVIYIYKYIYIRPGLYKCHKSLHSKMAPRKQSRTAQESWMCQRNAQQSYIPVPPYSMQKARLICGIVDSSWICCVRLTVLKSVFCSFIKNAKVNMCLYDWNIVWKTTYSSPVAFRTKLQIDYGRLCGLVLFISYPVW